MAMQIPFLDLLRQQQEIDTEVKAAVTRVLDSGNFILGREVAAFETEWASYCGGRAAAGVGRRARSAGRMRHRSGVPGGRRDARDPARRRGLRGRGGGGV